MTNNVLMAVLALVFSGATYAANFAELQKIEGETQSVTLKGKLATVTRSALTKDDQDIAERCGETYTVLLLEKPIQVRLTNLESGEDYEAVVQYLRTWGNP